MDDPIFSLIRGSAEVSAEENLLFQNRGVYL